MLNPARNTTRVMHYQSRNDTREDATYATHGQWLFVAGGFSYDDASLVNETMDVLDLVHNVAWTVSFSGTLPRGSRSVAAGHKVLFYHQRSRSMFTYDTTTNETGVMETARAYQGAAAYGTLIYFVARDSIARYNTTDGTWRNTTLRTSIRFGINMVFAAQIHNAVAVFVVTFRDVIQINPLLGTYTAKVTKIGPASAGVLHNDQLVLLHGPSRLTVNSILFYNVASNLQYSWQYDNYNFRTSSVTALNNTLYIADWRPNANFNSGRRLLVYDMAQSHHEFVPLHSADFVIQHADYLIAANFNAPSPRVQLYNLATNRNHTIPIDAAPRQNIRGLSARDYVFFYGGELLNSTVPPLQLYVLSPMSGQWIYTTIPSPYNAALVRVLGNTVYFVEDTDPIVHMYHASSNTWRTQELESHVIPDMVLYTSHRIIFLSTIRVTTAFDIYDESSNTWCLLHLPVGSRLHGAALIDGELFIAGGIDAQEVLLNTLIRYSLDTNSSATFNLTQARALPAIKWHGSLIAVIGGVWTDHLHLSDVIDVFDRNGTRVNSMTLPQPERLGLNFGQTVIDPWIYLRYNSNVYRLNLSNRTSDRLLVPVMAGSFIRAVGNYLVMYGELNNQHEFYFYDTSTPTSLHLSTTLAKVFFWKNFVLLYLNGLMRIELPTIERLEPRTIFVSQSTSFTPGTAGRNLTYSWAVNDHRQSESAAFRIDTNSRPAGQYQIRFAVRDRCGLTTQVTTSVEVLSKPNVELITDSSACGNISMATVRAHLARTDNTSFCWTRNGEPLNATGAVLSLQGFQCAITYNVCVIATNPAGSTKSCTDVFIPAYEHILPPIAAGLVIAAVVVVIVVRRRFSKVKRQEVELKSMLNAAKRDIIDKRVGKIISSISWEWTPDDSYSYCSPTQLPMVLDTSQLGFDKKHGPLDISVWFQGTLLMTSKKKAKTGRLSFLHQSLLDGEERFDIYAPKSPKFEVNVDPSSFALGDGCTVMLTVWVKLKITTKADIQLVVVSERTKKYSSLTFSVVGKPSPWIDVDDVEISDQVLGQGG